MRHIVLSLFLLHASLMYCQNPNTQISTKDHRGKQTINNFTFDNSEIKIGYKLPSNVKFDDFQAIHRKLLSVTKREFESTEDHQKRTSSVINQVFTLKYLLKFNYNEDTDLPGMGITYDADNEIFTVDHYLTGLSFNIKDQYVGSFNGKNSYGATTTVKKVIRPLAEIIPINVDTLAQILEKHHEFKKIHITFSATKSEAKTKHNKYYIVLCCNPGSTISEESQEIYAKKDTKFFAGTISDPNEVTLVQLKLYVSRIKYFIVDGATNVIVGQGQWFDPASWNAENDPE